MSLCNLNILTVFEKQNIPVALQTNELQFTYSNLQDENKIGWLERKVLAIITS